MTKQTCTKCGQPSIPGLIRGAGKCPYHWAAGVWGQKWADHLYPDPCNRLQKARPKY